MASDRHYVPGDNYFLDDHSGFKVRASKARIQWDNIATSGSRWDVRQPQLDVQGVRDDQIVALNRPRQTNQFTVVGTSVTAFAAAGATTIQVGSSAGFSAGNVAQVMLDAGENFQFTITATTATSLSWTGRGLPSAVGGGLGDPIENQVLNISAGDNVVIPPAG